MEGPHFFSVVQQDGEWTLLELGNAVPLLIAGSRAEMVTIGKQLAEQLGGRLTVHDPDGGVETELDYRA